MHDHRMHPACNSFRPVYFGRSGPGQPGGHEVAHIEEIQVGLSSVFWVWIQPVNATPELIAVKMTRTAIDLLQPFRFLVSG